MGNVSVLLRWGRDQFGRNWGESILSLPRYKVGDQSKIKIHLSDEQSEYIPFSWWAAIPASLVSITSVALSVVWWSIIPSAISAATDWGSGPGATSSAAITAVSLQGWARLLMTAHRNIIIKIASNPQNCIFMHKDLLSQDQLRLQPWGGMDDNNKNRDDTFFGDNFKSVYNQHSLFVGCSCPHDFVGWFLCRREI